MPSEYFLFFFSFSSIYFDYIRPSHYPGNDPIKFVLGTIKHASKLIIGCCWAFTREAHLCIFEVLSLVSNHWACLANLISHLEPDEYLQDCAKDQREAQCMVFLLQYADLSHIFVWGPVLRLGSWVHFTRYKGGRGWWCGLRQTPPCHSSTAWSIACVRIVATLAC